MRLSRTDLVPVLAIVAGGVIGASLSFSFLGSGSDDVPATEWSSEITGFPVPTETVGGTQRRAIGNAVAVVDAAAITAQVSITSMQQMLAARTPGLNFTRSDGTLGAGSSIDIRGFSSILIGNQPLIYVDGIRVDGFRDAGGSGGSALDDINPEDIESIEVIKGPAAATLYGTEASAGVIQIITKKER